ncbi:hypothetical protein VP01_2256g1, partial [Puccinia sorghi]
SSLKSSLMPRPPRKKAKRTSKRDDDFNGKEPAYQTDSSDHLNTLASLMKGLPVLQTNADNSSVQITVNRAPKIANQSFENFERKCLKLLEDITHQIESKINTHEENLYVHRHHFFPGYFIPIDSIASDSHFPISRFHVRNRLYRSVEQINEEIEPLENEAIFETIINKNFDEEVRQIMQYPDQLSISSSDRHELGEKLSRLISSEVHVRPEHFAEFSRRMTYECKRGFRLYCENNKLASDARKFKEKYKALMREVL